MEFRTVTALAERLAPHVDLSKARRETLGLLTLGMVSARTTNLSHLACERPGGGVKIASTYRRLQRFFQHVRLEDDWAAPMIAQLAGGSGPRRLILDRTNWKVGRREINLLVLAVATRRHRLALMWTVLDRAGNAGAPACIALLERYIAAFGKDSIGVLLADREFIGADWLNWLTGNDIPFVTRMRGGHHAVTDDANRWRLDTLLARPRGPRKVTARLPGVGTPLHFAAKRPAGREPVIVATNRPGPGALTAYRKRWAIETFFGDTKTRGLNFEDTRLTCPRKLHLLTAIVALATAWAARTATAAFPRSPPPRKAHGYLAKSWFRIGFDLIRNRLRSDPDKALNPWNVLNPMPRKIRVV